MTLAVVEQPGAGQMRSASSKPQRPADGRPGAVILDMDGRITVLSPVAEQLLGWRSQNVTGRLCSEVLQCQDEDGHSLCGHCGFSVALVQRELVPETPMHIADSTGNRRAMSTTFWYLPPAGRTYEPRVMVVMNTAD